VPSEPPPPELLAAPPLPPLPLGCPDEVPCDELLPVPLALLPAPLHDVTARMSTVRHPNKLHKYRISRG
jgi:hypothetical protein